MSGEQIRKKIGGVVSALILTVSMVMLVLLVGSRTMEQVSEETPDPEMSPEIAADGPTWTTILDSEGLPVTSNGANDTE